MKKLFTEYDGVSEKIYLNEEQSRHITKSLRMKKGDMLTVCTGDGNDYGCIIDDINKDGARLAVCYKQASDSEADIKVSLYQGVPKGDKFEDIIQKCTELGVYEIIPVLTKRCVSRPQEKQAEKKRQRYARIALEAAQQSGRGIVPEIKKMTELKTAVSQCEAEIKIVFYEGGGEPLSTIIKKGAKSAAVFIGPEGGFEKEEVELLKQNGAVAATLGKRILRTQTAPVAALSAIMLLTGNLE